MDITRDVMQMVQKGRPMREIQAKIHQRYGRYGPPTSRIRIRPSSG